MANATATAKPANARARKAAEKAIRDSKPVPEPAQKPAPTAPTAPESVVDLTRFQGVCETLNVLRSPVRLAIIEALATGSKNVGALCAITGQSQPNVSHHLSTMKGRVVSYIRDGKNVIYSLNDAGTSFASMIANMLK